MIVVVLLSAGVRSSLVRQLKVDVIVAQLLNKDVYH
jgi:hypothetical protein